jgi:hypothetical protein
MFCVSMSLPMRKSRRAVASPKTKRPHPFDPGFGLTDDLSLNVSDGDESPSVEAPLQRTRGEINPCAKLIQLEGQG